MADYILGSTCSDGRCGQPQPPVIMYSDVSPCGPRGCPTGNRVIAQPQYAETLPIAPVQQLYYPSCPGGRCNVQDRSPQTLEVTPLNHYQTNQPFDKVRHQGDVKNLFQYTDQNYGEALDAAARSGKPVVAVFGSERARGIMSYLPGVIGEAQKCSVNGRPTKDDAIYLYIDTDRAAKNEQLGKFIKDSHINGSEPRALVFNMEKDEGGGARPGTIRVQHNGFNIRDTQLAAEISSARAEARPIDVPTPGPSARDANEEKNPQRKVELKELKDHNHTPSDKSEATPREAALMKQLRDRESELLLKDIQLIQAQNKLEDLQARMEYRDRQFATMQRQMESMQKELQRLGGNAINPAPQNQFRSEQSTPQRTTEPRPQLQAEQPAPQRPVNPTAPRPQLQSEQPTPQRPLNPSAPRPQLQSEQATPQRPAAPQPQPQLEQPKPQRPVEQQRRPETAPQGGRPADTQNTNSAILDKVAMDPAKKAELAEKKAAERLNAFEKFCKAEEPRLAKALTTVRDDHPTATPETTNWLLKQDDMNILRDSDVRRKMNNMGTYWSTSGRMEDEDAIQRERMNQWHKLRSCASDCTDPNHESKQLLLQEFMQGKHLDGFRYGNANDSRSNPLKTDKLAWQNQAAEALNKVLTTNGVKHELATRLVIASLSDTSIPVETRTKLLDSIDPIAGDQKNDFLAGHARETAIAAVTRALIKSHETGESNGDFQRAAIKKLTAMNAAEACAVIKRVSEETPSTKTRDLAKDAALRLQASLQH